MASHLEQDFLSILLANISIQVCFQSISSAGEKKLSVCKSELNHDRTNKLYKTDVQRTNQTAMPHKILDQI